ncbi:MAG: hypothetical protein QM500_00485 [Methylococcales bacterium]
MQETIFGEFQYFIKRINDARSGKSLSNGDTLEDLEQRFRLQVENGLVIIDPGAQEVAMEILLSDISEPQKRNHLFELRRTGKTSFQINRTQKATLSHNTDPQKDAERALHLIVKALNKAGIKVQKRALSVKMLLAAHELGEMDYCDPDDLKLLYVKTIKISGHVRKANPLVLAKIFNDILPRSLPAY